MMYGFNASARYICFDGSGTKDRRQKAAIRKIDPGFSELPLRWCEWQLDPDHIYPQEST